MVNCFADISAQEVHGYSQTRSRLNVGKKHTHIGHKEVEAVSHTMFQILWVGLIFSDVAGLTLTLTHISVCGVCIWGGGGG